MPVCCIHGQCRPISATLLQVYIVQEIVVVIAHMHMLMKEVFPYIYLCTSQFASMLETACV